MLDLASSAGCQHILPLRTAPAGQPQLAVAFSRRCQRPVALRTARVDRVLTVRVAARSFERGGPYKEELAETAQYIARRGRGILA